MSDIGDKIREVRTHRGVTVTDLALRAAISRRTLQYIECGANIPNMRTVQKLAQALDVNVKEFLE